MNFFFRVGIAAALDVHSAGGFEALRRYPFCVVGAEEGDDPADIVSHADAAKSRDVLHVIRVILCNAAREIGGDDDVTGSRGLVIAAVGASGASAR
jgi:hypothetical protein